MRVLPVTAFHRCATAADRHAAPEREFQRREIELGEVRIMEQRVEQGVDPGERRKPVLPAAPSQSRGCRADWRSACSPPILRKPAPPSGRRRDRAAAPRGYAPCPRQGTDAARRGIAACWRRYCHGSGRRLWERRWFPRYIAGRRYRKDRRPRPAISSCADAQRARKGDGARNATMKAPCA